MRLKELLSGDVIRIPLKNTEKNAIIEEMVDILDKAGKLKDKRAVLKAVLEREQVMSTGMGDGIAIPHAKTDGVEKLIAAFGVTKEPVDFKSIDNKPVRIIFILVGPPDLTSPHLKVLSRISRLTHRKEFREKLAAAQSSKDVIDTITQEEQKHFVI